MPTEQWGHTALTHYLLALYDRANDISADIKDTINSGQVNTYQRVDLGHAHVRLDAVLSMIRRAIFGIDGLTADERVYLQHRLGTPQPDQYIHAIRRGQASLGL